MKMSVVLLASSPWLTATSGSFTHAVALGLEIKELGSTVGHAGPVYGPYMGQQPVYGLREKQAHLHTASVLRG